MSSRELQRRLRAAAELETPTLGPYDFRRIAGQVATAGPSVIARARLERTLTRTGGVVVAMAAAVALWVGAGALGSGSGRTATHSEPGMQGLGTPGAAACESRSVAAGAQFVASGEERRLQIGTSLSAVAAAASDVAVEHATACDTALMLRSGTVTVRAGDLGGGRVSVTTPGGTVTSQGGLFTVGVAGAELVFQVVDGSLDAGGKMLWAGTKATFAAGKLTESTLDAAEAAAIRRR